MQSGDKAGEAAEAAEAAEAEAAVEAEADAGKAAATGWTDGAEEAADAEEAAPQPAGLWEVPGGEAEPPSCGTGEPPATAGPMLAEAVRASGRLRRAFLRLHRGWAQLEHAAATRPQAWRLPAPAAEAVLEACERHGVLLQRLERARHSHAAMVISEPGVLGAWPSGAAMVISELRTEADALSAILEGVAPLLNTSGDAGL